MPVNARFDFNLSTAADADGICQSQTPSGAGALTINGALASGGVATLGTGANQRQVLITAAADDSARTFTVTGTNWDGVEISETIAGPNATTAASVLSYQTVTSVTVDAGTAGAITVGTNGVGDSPLIPMNVRQTPFNVSVGVVADGTIDYTVRHTFDDVLGQSASTQHNYFDHDSTDLVNATASQDGNYAFPVTGISVRINSGTGTLKIRIYQGA